MWGVMGDSILSVNRITSSKQNTSDVVASSILKESGIEFINSICSKKKELSNSRIKSIIESISFDLLKNKEQEEGFPESVADQNRNKISFFYLGKKNQWDKIYDQKKIEKLNNVFKAELIDLKYV